jgi:hypothetical protein
VGVSTYLGSPDDVAFTTIVVVVMRGTECGGSHAVGDDGVRAPLLACLYLVVSGVNGWRLSTKYSPHWVYGLVPIWHSRFFSGIGVGFAACMCREMLCRGWMRTEVATMVR